MKTPILLLHGALGAASQFATLKQHLAKVYEVHSLDFSGHGDRPPIPAFSIPLFAQDVLDYLAANELDSVAVFGYSMGGYVAAYLAKRHPERISKLMTLATKWDWDEAIALKETAMLDVEKIALKVPQLAAALTERHHHTNWKDLVNRTATMMLEMGRDNPLKPDHYTSLNLPMQLLLGDRDKMVSLTETVNIYKALPNASMCMLPNTPHAFEAVNLNLLSILIQHFI